MPAGIDNVLAATNATGPESSGAERLDAIGDLGGEAFLQLLIAQLRNQDPMNPTDSEELLHQTAQFTQLETLQQLDDRLADTLAAQQRQTAASLVGQDVTVRTGGEEETGTVTGVAFRDGDTPVLAVDDEAVDLADVLGVGDLPDDDRDLFADSDEPDDGTGELTGDVD